MKATFSFLKPKRSGSDIAAGVFDSIQQRYNAGFPQSRDLLPDRGQIDADAVLQEWLYLQIFTFDFATYNALGESPAKSNVLTPFLRRVKAWLEPMPVPDLPERVALAVVGVEPLSTIPAERNDSGLDRLSRRTEEYASAVATRHPQGESYSVAAVFAARCGGMGLSSITGVSVHFSSMVSEITKLLTRSRIVP